MKRILFIAIALIAFSFPASAAQSEASVVKAFLSTRTPEEKESGEGKESKGSTSADLDNDGRPEIILVWTAHGPTYWHNNLTVFSSKSGAYKPVDTMVLNGAAKLVRTKGRTIVVDQIEYAKGDPLCCPSIHREEHYAFQNGEIVQLR